MLRTKTIECPICKKESQIDESLTNLQVIREKDVLESDVVKFECEKGHAFFINRLFTETEECHGCGKRISAGTPMAENVWFCEKCYDIFRAAMDKR